MRIEPEIGGVAIVLLGHFNPSIFSPLWFSRHGVVSEAEADEAELGVIHPEVVMFKLGSKSIHIEQGRFQIETSEAPWVTILDFVAKTFGELLVHTPIKAFGVNRQAHFKLRSDEDRMRLGRALAPIEPWGDWGREMASKSKDLSSGVVDLAMREQWAEGKWSGYIQTTIQPSAILSGNAGIYMRVNHHNVYDDDDPALGSELLISYLYQKFESSIARAEHIIDQIMTLGIEAH